MSHDEDQLDVAILGGGVSGFSCAYRLKAAGIPCVVYEREAFIGGPTMVVHIAGDYVPSGAGVIYRGAPTD